MGWSGPVVGSAVGSILGAIVGSALGSTLGPSEGSTEGITPSIAMTKSSFRPDTPCTFDNRKILKVLVSVRNKK